MNYRDQWATDDSGNRFLFTVEMQRKLHEAGLPVQPESLPQLNRGTPQPVVEAVTEEQETPEEVIDQEPEPETIDYEEPATIQIDPQTGKYIGRVKWYNVAKGYGFISRGGGQDIFFHKTDIICEAKDLDQGVWILYDVEETEKGLEASEVELYLGPPPI